MTPVRRDMSYQEAADFLGVDHHWIRMLTHKGKFEVTRRVEIRPNVLKVYISTADVEAYAERRRARYTKKIRVTENEWHKVQSFLDDLRKE